MISQGIFENHVSYAYHFFKGAVNVADTLQHIPVEWINTQPLEIVNPISVSATAVIPTTNAEGLA